MLNNLYKYMSISGIVNLEDSVLGNPQITGEKKNYYYYYYYVLLGLLKLIPKNNIYYERKCIALKNDFK